jgi:hypothetical protein
VASPAVRCAPDLGNAPYVGALIRMRILGLRSCLFVIGVSLGAGTAFAQTASPAPNGATPGANSSAPGESLSKELDQSNGVIHPKEVDPAIQKPAPSTGDPNVVAPPGASGGATAPQPK